MSKNQFTPYISADFINQSTNYPELISELKNAFSDNSITVPDRHHHSFGSQENSTLLLMPAWQNNFDIGLKMVTVNPENTSLGIASIQGLYILADAATGIPKAILDAKALTNKRTAATSALAASFLARENATSLLMIGTGSMAPELIKAHASLRPIEQVFIWGRNFEKAKTLQNSFAHESFELTAIKAINDKINAVDIISAATFTSDPLIKGMDLITGQHIDLVGSYKPDMREADDNTIQKARIFVDTYDAATKESGDLSLPLKSGLIKISDIHADLHELCSGKHPGRTDPKSITLFKSVGYALEDLIAARYYYQQYVIT